MNSIRLSLILIATACLIYDHPAGSSDLIPDSESTRSQTPQRRSDINSKPQDRNTLAGPGGKNPKTNSPDVSGEWYFEIANNQHHGFIVLRQSGTQVTGTWHTTSKEEDDTPVVGHLDGNTIFLQRSKVWGSHDQTFELSLLRDGNQLFGYGEGFFLHHTDLNMRRVSGQPAKSTGKISNTKPTKKQSP